MEKFCCEDLLYVITNPRTSISYDPIDRRFCIEGDQGLKIDYCPWCAKKLPKDLREEWFETLEREYGIETDVGEARDRTDIPQEFWSDEWWKKRGL
jgi:hypothetical protein